jgi:hypothetical protein
MSRFMGDDLTIFTVPRSFKGDIGIIQTNAVESWSLAFPSAEILFISDDDGVDQKAHKLGCIHIPGVQCNEYGTPMVDDVFKKAQDRARHNVLCYINTDIVMVRGFPAAIQRAKEFKRFLMIGQRLDWYYPHPIDFSVGGIAQFWARALRKGNLHGPTAIDYHVFTRELYDKILGFALGRRAWDNWLVMDVLRREIPVIDATDVIKIVHIGKTTTKPLTEEIKRNRSLSGEAGTWGRVNFATWKMRPIYGYQKRKP